MKKAIAYTLCLLLLLTPLAVFAAGAEAENNSTPRFTVTGYELSESYLSPDAAATLSITFKNHNNAKAIYNIMLSLEDPSGEILSEGMPTQYVAKVSAGGTYTWTVELKATYSAAIGSHDLTVSSEYEDKYYSSYASSDKVRIDVRQPVKLKYNGVELPKKVVQGETETLDITIMNTGKSSIYNCTVDFDIDKMSSGGSVFVGNIESAQSETCTANLKIDSDALGDVKGKVVITYEDSYGKEYKKTVKVSTLIEEKKEEVFIDEEEEKEGKTSLWWLFMMIGAAVGGGIGFGVPWAIRDKKQRKEDDLRL